MARRFQMEWSFGGQVIKTRLRERRTTRFTLLACRASSEFNISVLETVEKRINSTISLRSDTDQNPDKFIHAVKFGERLVRLDADARTVFQGFCPDREDRDGHTQLQQGKMVLLPKTYRAIPLKEFRKRVARPVITGQRAKRSTDSKSPRR
jgi:hypothetical protein